MTGKVSGCGMPQGCETAQVSCENSKEVKWTPEYFARKFVEDELDSKPNPYCATKAASVARRLRAKFDSPPPL